MTFPIMTCRTIIFIALFSFYLFIPLPGYAAITQDRLLDTLGAGRWEEAYNLSQHGGDPFVRALATWYYLVRSNTIAPYREYERFLDDHRDWPHQALLKKRMEMAFLNTDPSAAALIQWFGKHPPRSSRGALLYAIASGKLSEERLQTYWIEGQFSPREEELILSRYQSALPVAIQEQRMDHLLWSGNINAAERLMPYVSPAVQLLSRARMSLREGRPKAPVLVASVPVSLLSNPGLIYERVRYRASLKDYDGVKALLLAAPRTLPHAHHWWNYQSRAIREAIEAKDYHSAQILLDKHSQINPLQRVDAEWMRGWLYDVFLKEPAKAYPAFENVYASAKLPISRARGAYWAGRALEDAGKKNEADQWFKKAALFPTTFYGQLAYQHLYPNTPLPLPKALSPTAAQLNQFVAKTPLAAQLKNFAASGNEQLLWPLIAYHVVHTHAPEYGARMAALARSLNKNALAINIAREVQNKGIYLPELYPFIATPDNMAIDPAFALAVARQESRFDTRARSPADARGLMQLLPTTARLVAKSHGLVFDAISLYKADYNLVLGSHYMRGLLERFRGSHVLAIASYNAGPSKPDQWLERFGAIGGNYKQTIQWTEMIPYGETRNYVQRVLENYHVYRHLLSGGKAKLEAEQALSDSVVAPSVKNVVFSTQSEGVTVPPKEVISTPFKKAVPPTRKKVASTSQKKKTSAIHKKTVSPSTHSKHSRKAPHKTVKKHMDNQ